VTDRPCPHCGAALTSGDVLCRAGRTNLRLDLEAVPGVLQELDMAMSRQTAMPPSHGAGGCPDGCGHGDDDPRCVAGVRLDLDERASAARLALVTVLHGRVRVLDEQHPAPHDDPDARRLRDRMLSTAQGQAALLWSWLPLIGAPAWLPDLARELRDALDEAWAAVERPADSTVVGRCPQCSTTLYAPETAAVVRCRACGTSGLRDDIREASLAESKKLLTADQLGTAFSDGNEDLAKKISARVRKWRQRGLLASVRNNIKGQPVYRTADAQKLLSRTDERDTDDTPAAIDASRLHR